MFDTQKKPLNYYSKAMVHDASDYLWKNFGISVGTPEYQWDNDVLIEEAVKKGWKFSFY
jgi:hypothetical protein